MKQRCGLCGGHEAHTHPVGCCDNCVSEISEQIELAERIAAKAEAAGQGAVAARYRAKAEGLAL